MKSGTAILNVAIDDPAADGNYMEVINQLDQLLATVKHSSVEPYSKFRNCYYVHFTFIVKSPFGVVHEAHRLANAICSPWLSWYHEDEGRIELIYNRKDYTELGDSSFSTLRWAQLEAWW